MPDLKTALEAHRPYGLDCKCGRPINSDADWAGHLDEVIAALPGVAVTQLPDAQADLEAEVDRLRAENATNRRLSGQANYLLARIVAVANLGAIEGADGFIEAYNLPVGPIHKAIPFLAEQGIAVTQDGQIKNGPAAVVLSEGETRDA